MESSTLRSQIEGYTRLLIFRKFSTLPAVIWASPLINFLENFQPSCFFTYTSEKFSTLPAVIDFSSASLLGLNWKSSQGMQDSSQTSTQFDFSLRHTIVPDFDFATQYVEGKLNKNMYSWAKASKNEVTLTQKVIYFFQYQKQSLNNLWAGVFY